MWKRQLAFLLFLAAALPTLGYNVPLNSTKVTPDILTAACKGQGSLRVCHPFGKKTAYIQCGVKAAVKSCKQGLLFDYVTRSCLAKALARPCSFWHCPSGGGAALSRPIGTFGQPGNATLQLTKAESFYVLCPVNGHCMAGMLFKVKVECPAPPDRYPMKFDINFVETLQNSDAYPRRLADISAYCGDSLFVEWHEPFHLLQTFNTSRANQAAWNDMMVSATVPQPVYECPTWSLDHTTEAPIPLANETVVIPYGIGPKNGTWTATKPESLIVVCAFTNHCRLGMIFKVTVTAAPAGYTPKQYNLNWILSYDLYEDMNVMVGDSIFFSWSSPNALHGVSTLPADMIKKLA